MAHDAHDDEFRAHGSTPLNWRRMEKNL